MVKVNYKKTTVLTSTVWDLWTQRFMLCCSNWVSMFAPTNWIHFIIGLKQEDAHTACHLAAGSTLRQHNHSAHPSQNAILTSAHLNLPTQGRCCNVSRIACNHLFYITEHNITGTRLNNCSWEGGTHQWCVYNVNSEKWQIKYLKCV